MNYVWIYAVILPLVMSFSSSLDVSHIKACIYMWMNLIYFSSQSDYKYLRSRGHAFNLFDLQFSHL